MNAGCVESARRLGPDIDFSREEKGDEIILFKKPRRLALVACSKRKLGYKAKAKELYTGTLFKLSLAYARKLKADKVFILSAKYGLLDPERKIAPYDKTLKGMPARDVERWAAGVAADLDKQTDLQGDHFILLAGNDYRKHLIPYLRSFEIPLQGMRQGEQLSFLKRQTGL
jgi:hypothetical protein